MDAYGDIVREIATEHNASLVDTQAAFAPMLENMHPCAIAADRVHPGMHGHMAIAKAFLNAFGC
jgi:lysophospholipase L1-like esterase